MLHQMSLGVERAVAAARARAEEAGCPIRLVDLVLALLEEDEGRPAVLLERAGLDVPQIRERLSTLADSPEAPAETVLYTEARDWSVTHRHDPAFLTDAFLLAVLRANPSFRQTVSELGLDVDRLEAILTGFQRQKADVTTPAPQPTEPNPTLAVFSGADAAGDAAAARILDVNFNRAREAARVLEDYCRFALDDRFLTEQVKELRHELAAASDRLPARLLLSSRETRQDVGTSVTAGGEYDRGSSAHVAAVNVKRLQESLRSLEEFGKLFGPELGRALEAARYRTYTVERAIAAGTRGRDKLFEARLYVLLSGSQCTASLEWTIKEAAAGGVDIVQLREKALTDRELFSRARDVRQWTRTAGVSFIVNDRPDIARLVEADGVHLGQDDLPVKEARRIIGPDGLIGVSTHTLDQVRQAVLDGADYIGVGPVFPSNTKSFDALAGLDFVRAASAETTLPAFALGGIEPRNLTDVMAAGAQRIAVSSTIATADEPRQIAQQLRAGLE